MQRHAGDLPADEVPQVTSPLDLIAQAHRDEPGAMTLERLLTSQAGFGLTTASTLQRAICRAAEGRPLGELAVPEVTQRFVHLPTGWPSEVLLLAGIRTAKSLMAAAAGVKASQSCDVSKLGPGEVPRVSIVSTVKDNADVILNHIVGNVQAKPSLRRLLLEAPTGDTVLLRHPSGRPVEVRVVAGSRAGHTLVSRWSAGVVFDEAPRMIGAGDGVVNLDDCRAATLGRMLPGAQIWYIGSPWAPFGPVWEMVQAPGAGMLVIRAPAYEMWPEHWTRERCEALRVADPTVHRTDVEAEFADPETALLSSVDIDACTRKGPMHIEPAYGHSYFATMDAGTRGNAWTLVIATRDAAGRMVVVYNQEWVGSKVQPLKPGKVLKEQAEACHRYGVREVWADGWSIDALQDLAEQVGLSLIVRRADAATNWNRYHGLATKLAERMAELPPDPVLRGDLLALKRRITQTGTAIVLPQTSNGRHCDYAPALVLALARYLEEPAVQAPAPGTREAWELAERDEEEREEREERRRERGPYGDDSGWDIGA
jgi:hypothetical protein